MKKLFSAILCVVSLNAFSQASKWFISASAGGTIGGPSVSIKSQMKKQGFDDTGTSNFLGWTSTTHYPEKTWDASVLVSIGFKLTDRRSIYVTGGLLENAEVRGFKNTGYSNFLGLFSGSDGPRPMIKYSIYQMTAGYMYSSAKSRVKLGFGPSIFLVNHASGMNYSYGETIHSVVPGISGMARIPLRKEKRMFGAELFVETNLAPPIKMNTSEGPAKDIFYMKSANMISANVGFAFRLQKPASKK
jgi:hypothetical protein